MDRAWSASYARGLRLVKSGCALPYLNDLPGRTRHFQRALFAEEIGGYLESCAFATDLTTVYAIPLRIGTDRGSGAIVTQHSFVPPWADHLIDWDQDPEKAIPQNKLHEFKHLLDSRLHAVLNRRELLYRGRPVEGLLCGRAYDSIPDGISRAVPTPAEISLVDDSGELVRAPIRLRIIGDQPREARAPVPRRSLLSSPDRK